jgi:hypothetical protein
LLEPDEVIVQLLEAGQRGLGGLVDELVYLDLDFSFL